MADIAQLSILLRADDEASPSINRVDLALKGLGDTAGRTSPGLGALSAAFAVGNLAASALQSALSGLTSIFGQGVGAAFDYNAALARNQIAFANLLGSASEAKDFLADLEQFAATTPFEMPGLTKAAQLFLSIGVEASNVIPILSDLGGAIQLGGGTAADIEAATVQIAQMGRIGKVTQENLQDLSNHGVNGMAILAAGTHKSQGEIAADITAGKVSFADFINSLHTISAERGWADVLVEGSRTLEGSLSTLSDAGRKAAGEALKPLVDVATDLALKAAEFAGGGDFQAAIAGIGAAGEAAVAILREDLGPALQDLVSGGGLAEFAAGAATNFRNFIVGLDFMARETISTAQGIGQIFDDLTVVIAASLQIAGQALGGFGDALGKLNQGDFQGAIEAFRGSAERARPALDALGTAVGGIGQAFTDAEGRSRDNAQSAAEDGQRITTAFTGAFDAITGGSNRASTAFKPLKDDLNAVDPKKLQAYNEKLAELGEKESEIRSAFAEKDTDLRTAFYQKIGEMDNKYLDQVRANTLQEEDIREASLTRQEEARKKHEADKKSAQQRLAEIDVLQQIGSATPEEAAKLQAEREQLQARIKAEDALFDKREASAKAYQAIIDQVSGAKSIRDVNALEDQIRAMQKEERKQGTYDKDAQREVTDLFQLEKRRWKETLDYLGDRGSLEEDTNDKILDAYGKEVKGLNDVAKARAKLVDPRTGKPLASAAGVAGATAGGTPADLQRALTAGAGPGGTTYILQVGNFSTEMPDVVAKWFQEIVALLMGKAGNLASGRV